MGTLMEHAAPGFCFFVLGLWRLLNHIKLHALNPNSTSLPWFPTSKLRYLELFWIMGSCFLSFSIEIFGGPDSDWQHPLDSDGTIPSDHLRYYEHISISITFFVYAAFAITLDRIGSHAQHGLTLLLEAIAFGQQLLLFHFHSADHMGLEGQYHLLLQIVIFVCVITALMGIGYPKSFLISFVKSLSILFQGVWFMVMGFMLWTTPRFVPQGCYMKLEKGYKVVRCRGHEALQRAKSLINIQFSWYLILLTIFGMCLYLFFNKVYGSKSEYHPLSKYEEQDEEAEDVEAQKQNKLGKSNSSIHMGKAYAPMDIEK